MPLPYSNKLHDNFIFDLLRESTKENIKEFRKYIEVLERKFHDDIKELHSNLETQDNNISSQELNEIERHYGDEFYKIEITHLGIFRYSTTISLYSFLESELNTLCKHVYKNLDTSIQHTDLPRNGIKRARKYLLEVAGIDFNESNTEWSSILNLNKIRNNIVHCNGHIRASNNPTEIKEIINKNPHLSLTYTSKIKIESKFIEQTISDIENFFGNIYQQLLN